MTSALTSKRFLAAFAIVMLVGFGLPFGVDQLVLAARKDAIDIRRPLATIEPDVLPSFTLRRDLFIDAAGPEWVGTEEMIIYPAEPLDPKWPGRRSASTLPTLFVTYYSDPDETIPHTPEVCYVQAGSAITSATLAPINIAGRDDNPERAKRLLIERGDDRRIVMYVLYHNGKVLDDRAQVRLAMALPGADRTYFAKIETVQPITPNVDEAAAERIATQLLEEAIAAVSAEHLPFDDDLLDAD